MERINQILYYIKITIKGVRVSVSIYKRTDGANNRRAAVGTVPLKIIGGGDAPHKEPALANAVKARGGAVAEPSQPDLRGPPRGSPCGWVWSRRVCTASRAAGMTARVVNLRQRQTALEPADAPRCFARRRHRRFHFPERIGHRGFRSGRMRRRMRRQAIQRWRR